MLVITWTLCEICSFAFFWWRRSVKFVNFFRGVELKRWKFENLWYIHTYICIFMHLLLIISDNFHFIRSKLFHISTTSFVTWSFVPSFRHEQHFVSNIFLRSRKRQTVVHRTTFSQFHSYTLVTIHTSVLLHLLASNTCSSRPLLTEGQMNVKLVGIVTAFYLRLRITPWKRKVTVKLKLVLQLIGKLSTPTTLPMWNRPPGFRN